MTDLRIRTDRTLIRPNHRSHRFVLAQVTAPAATQQRRRAPVNLAFVLDRSGSMSGGALDLAKQAVEAALAGLDADDRFSIVVYDDVIDTIVGSTPASAEARRNAVERMADVDARGSTNLAGGWFRGCEEVAQHLTEHGVHRVLLLTDGLANQGLTDPAQLAAHAAELRARGVSTTTFGVGTAFDEALLQAMADAGAGHFYYIADAAQIRDHIASEVGEALEIVARNAVLEIQLGDGVEVEAISPQPLTRRGDRSVLALGDLVADQALDVVLRLTFPYGQLGAGTGLILTIADSDGAFQAHGIHDRRLGWEWADDRANDGQPRDTAVDRAVARQFAARARQAAVVHNHAGQYAQGRLVLKATAGRIRKYAARDAELRGLVADLDSDAERFAEALSAPSLKEVHYASANMARSRDGKGHSLKSR